MDDELKALLGEALPLLREAVPLLREAIPLLKDVRGAQEELTEAVMAQTGAVKDLSDGLKPQNGEEENPIVVAIERVTKAVGRVELAQDLLRKELPGQLGEEVENRFVEAIDHARKPAQQAEAA